MQWLALMPDSEVVLGSVWARAPMTLNGISVESKNNAGVHRFRSGIKSCKLQVFVFGVVVAGLQVKVVCVDQSFLIKSDYYAVI